jgi:hypothetical protein
MQKVYLFIFLILLIACGQPPSEVEGVLEKSGKNRKQLEKVFRHYSAPQDSLKLKAAIFLIMNMEGKTSYSDKKYERILNLVYSYKLNTITDKKELADKREELYEKLLKYDESTFKKSIDLEELNAKTLINYIDNAFVSWAMPWSKDRVSFEQFCKYVLPYKMADEPFEVGWREQVWADFAPLIDSLKKADANLHDVAEAVNNQVAILYDAFAKASYSARFGYTDSKAVSIGSCLHTSAYTMYILRALGVPISYDYVLFFGNRSTNHGWVAVHMPDGSLLPFDPAYKFKFFQSRFVPKVSITRIPPATAVFLKVYRNTFENQIHESLELRSRVLGLQYNTLDITDKYCPVSTISLKFDSYVGVEKKVFLLVYKYGKWTPVSMSLNNSKGNFIFEKLGRKVVYLPAILNNTHEFSPIGNAFILDSVGNINYLVPNLVDMQKVTLYRKYPYSVRMASYAERLKGGKFQASHKKDFTDCITFYEIKERPLPYYYRETVQLNEPYKYYRYLAPDSTYGSIAEIEFYISNQSEPVYGKPIGLNVADKAYTVDKAFDKNKITCFNSDDNDKPVWAGMIYDSPIIVNKVGYLPRNDLNTVEVGDLYELFYWDNSWISLGQQTATKQSLEYKAPRGALLWLRNLSGGKEERPFTYENNQQVWW